MYSQIKGSYAEDDTKLLHDLFVLLFAGHDTGSHTLTSMMYYMLKYPQECELLQVELREVVGDGRIEDLTYKQLNDMSRLNWFMRESLRLDPATPMSVMYSAKQRTTVCGVDVP